MKTDVASPESKSPTQPAESPWRESGSLPQLAKKVNSTAVEDTYQSIIWRIDAQSTEATAAVGLAGSQSLSGSSTLAANLALEASKQQRGRVLLVDANWDGPGLLKKLNASKQTGLFDILSGDFSPRECDPQSISENLDFLCRGRWEKPQPTHVRQELVEAMLAELKQQYSLIIVDLPVAEDQRSALPLARELDGTLLVVRFEAVKPTHAQRVLRRLQADGVTVWGSILNRHREYVPEWLQSWL